jgi:hypothetical protein
MLKSFSRYLTEIDITLAYHKELNPRLWDGTSMKPEVREKLLQFGYHFAEYAKVPEQYIQDVLACGGNVNFNYTEFSDIDVHVLVNRSMLGSPDLVEDYLKLKKENWTLKHHVKIAGYDVEPYIQDIGEKSPPGQGVFSLLNNQWVHTPVRGNYDFQNDPVLQAKTDHYAHLIDSMIERDADRSHLEALKQKITQMRRTGIAQGGEFATENLVFKALRNAGYLEKMTKYLNSKIDKHLSL